MRLIDADALKDEVMKIWAYIQCTTGDDVMNAVMTDIKNAPTVDAEPVRHGHWIWKERKGIREAWYQCSECNAYDLREIDVTSHYCWACGSKMDDLPTSAKCEEVDAVPVVRCKDCKHYRTSDAGHPDCDYCDRLICGTIKPDFYCADGERKTE